MFETGAKQRGEYQKGIGSIFDQFSKGMDRYGSLMESERASRFVDVPGRS